MAAGRLGQLSRSVTPHYDLNDELLLETSI